MPVFFTDEVIKIKLRFSVCTNVHTRPVLVLLISLSPETTYQKSYYFIEKISKSITLVFFHFMIHPSFM
jgi:hypothetical protein